MAVLHTNTADAFTPEAYGALVDLAVKAKSVAAKTATVVATNKVTINFPKWIADPAVGWYTENSEITETDPTTGEVSVTPYKTAGLTRISRELRDDSSPAVANLVGSGLANQITRSLDAAYLGDTGANRPNGLLSIDYTSVAVENLGWLNLDPFISARFAASAAGSELTSWIVSPTTAENLSQVRVEAGSNLPLLEFVEDGLRVVGLPVLVSDQVDAGTVAWGIPREHVVAVLRQGTEVVASADAAFAHDAILIRGVARWGLGYLNEPGVIRLTASPVAYSLDLGGASGGTYTLSVNGKATAAIAYNANAAAIKSAIVAIDDGIGATDVTVTGSGPFAIGVPGTLTANFASLTGATSPALNNA